MRVHGLMENASGVPTAALADEILQDGDGQIRALFCVGGNPVLAWPDQLKTEAALRKLDLLVVFDYRLTATAQFAHYVVPPPLSLELPGSSQKVESLKYSGVSRGYPFPWAQYTPAVAQAPAGSELLDDATFFFLLARELGLQLDWVNARGQGPNVEGPSTPVPLDMDTIPSAEQMVEWTCRGSRVPLDEVRQHPHGHVFEHDVRVQARDPSCTARLELAAPLMLAQLRELRHERKAADLDPAFPLQLIARRANNFMNSVGQMVGRATRDRLLPPAAMHPFDAKALGVEEGMEVRIESRHGHMRALAEIDDSLRQGTLSVVHGFGCAATTKDADAVHSEGSVNRLVGHSELDPVSGIPRMSGIPVRVTC
jgi:anaerobic selenocysteine-containing dehydrogenase